jgi:hypothetical protein
MSAPRPRPHEGRPPHCCCHFSWTTTSLEIEDGFRTRLLIGCGVAVVSAAGALLIPAAHTGTEDATAGKTPGRAGAGPRLSLYANPSPS